MGDDTPAATLDGQFQEFAKLFDPKRRDGQTITLYRLDYWLRQARILDERTVTMTDTGNLFFEKFSKTEINFEEFESFIEDLAILKNMDPEKVAEAMTVCGLPGEISVEEPKYRFFFKTYKPKSALVLK